MGEMGRLAAVAVAAALCALVVRKTAPELGLVLSLCAGAVLLWGAWEALTEVDRLWESLGSAAGMTPALVTPVVKAVGVAILTRLTVQVCKDAGEGGIAGFVELAGTLIGLALCVPLLELVLGEIMKLL